MVLSHQAAEAKLALEVIRICAALAWADGTIAADEVRSLRQMIERAPLDDAGRRAAFDFLSQPMKLDDADAGLTGALAPHTYRAAATLAFSDGQLHPDERAFLDRLRVRLGLDERTAFSLELAAARRTLGVPQPVCTR